MKRGISIASMVFLPTHPSLWSYIKLPLPLPFLLSTTITDPTTTHSKRKAFSVRPTIESL